MNKIYTLIIFGLIFGGQVQASTSTSTPAVTKEIASTTPVVSIVKATSTKATTSATKLATSTKSSNIVATSTEALATSSLLTALATTTVKAPTASGSSSAKTGENLSALYGSVDPISLEVSSTSATSTDTAIATDDATNTAGLSSNAAAQADQVAQAEANSVQPTLAGKLQVLFSNIFIKLLCGLALIFLLTAIVFHYLAKRHDRRNSI